MQFEEIQRIREEWGDKPCDHPSIDNEYILGSQTGDYVCIQCGISHPDRSFFNKN